MKILGIETSCDETSAAVIEDGHSMLSNVVSSSIDLHIPYGGVVPEVAARSHLEVIIPVIDQALVQAKCEWQDIDAIAVTYGAGLGGSLLIGVLSARSLALAFDKPLYGVNHVESHVYANFLTATSLPGYTMPVEQPEFPMLAVIVSGGHSQLVLFKNHFSYVLLGRTLDDTIGEAFDKVAKILGLPYPGGPSIGKMAKNGDAYAYTFPIAKMNKYDFSFSGLKTAVLRAAQAEIGENYDFPSTKLAERLSEPQKANIAASFQRIAVETIVEKVIKAFNEYSPKSVVLAGGVASNEELRNKLSNRLPISINYPDTKLCTDNGAMVGALGYFKASSHQPASDPYSLDIASNLSM